MTERVRRKLVASLESPTMGFARTVLGHVDNKVPP
jgi:hypothetical protein